MKRIGIIQVIKEDKNKFALPNLFTVLRLVFLPFILFFLWQGTRKDDMLALVFMLAACSTDFLDGYLARRLNQKSNLGRMLDPLIDKISVDAAMLVLAAQKGLPYWYVIVVICRDFFLLLGGTFVISKKRLVIESNMLGKTTATLFALVIITYTLDLPYIKQALMHISLALVPMTVVGYVHKYYDELRRLSKRKKPAVKEVERV